MKLIPVKIEYFFELRQHHMRSFVEHIDNERNVHFYFDEKQVSVKTIPDDSFLTDDDCICEFVQNYTQTHTDVFADLFKNHADTVRLVKKTVDVKIESGGFLIDANVTSEPGSYAIALSANGGADAVSIKFKAASFSEALEKTRIFISTLEGVSAELSEHISELSNDMVMKFVKWN